MARTDYYHDPAAPKATRLVPAVSAVLCSSDGKVMLHRRRDSGNWSLIGGAIEPGEGIVEALLREILEETGLAAKVERLIGIYSDPGHIIAYSDGEVRQQFSICFACTIVSGIPVASDESFEIGLFARDELGGLTIHPANMQRIDDFFAFADDPFIR